MGGRLCRRAVVLAVVGLALVAARPASAHETGPGESDSDAAAHARTDLAGVPISTIERETEANKRRLDTDRVQRLARDRASTGRVSPDPGRSGRWSRVVSTPLVPVFEAVLPDGKVLMWDSVGDNAVQTYPDQSFTRAMVWNPADDTYRRVDLQGYNIFCAGYTQLPDGNVLVVGGNKDQQADGIKQTHIFDWRTETWSRGPDMDAERWYPAVAALANGDAVIVGGGSGQAEVYRADGTIRELSGFTSFAEKLYAFLVPRGDGRVELVGPRSTMSTMDVDGAGSLDATTARDHIDRDYGSFATYLPDRTLVAGGGNVTEGGVDHVPTRTAEIVDTRGSGTTVTATGSMRFPRRQFDLTLLADGSVLATGGERRADQPLVDLAHPVFAAERWDPATGRWTTLASAARVREYHSSATLLPDGRVLTGGGGICDVCMQDGYLEKDVEYFTPPYLYRHDGSGRLAPRPVLTGVPGAVSVGARFTVHSAQAAVITRLALVRLGAPTHGVDQGQRYVPVHFTRSGTTLTVSAPRTATSAPPGYYMLFAIDRHGVPSVARVVQVFGADGPPDLSLHQPARAWNTEPISDAAGRAVDGDTATSWVSGRGDYQWWQVDLGAVQTAREVVVAWDRADPRPFQVQTSVDGAAWRTVGVVRPHSGSVTRSWFDLRDARFVRVQAAQTGVTQPGFAIAEVRVFGG